MSANAKRQHEEFNIDSTTPAGRKKLVRQDRIYVEDNECFLEKGSLRLKVMNLSAFGLAFMCEGKFEELNETNDFRLTFDGSAVADVNVRYVRRFVQDGLTYTGVEIVGEPIPLSRITAVKNANAILHEQIKNVKAVSIVPVDFRLHVLEARDWLETLKKEIDAVEVQLKQQDGRTDREFEDAFVEIMGTFLRDAMPAKNNAITKFLPKDPEVLKASVEYFRTKLYDLIYQAPFSNRVFHKPLGYAGDYEMMNIIYREPASGDSLFAKCLNHYWIMEPAAQAVRNRADYLMTQIRKTFENVSTSDPAFLSVACGPAKEWQRMISEEKAYNFRKATVHLLDQDEGALKHAQRQMRTLSAKDQNRFEFGYLNNAIKNIIVRGMDSQQYDLIYSAGLFDYFSAPVAQMAAMKLFTAVKPGGRLIIGNFNVSNPNSIMMNLALDWNLIYRSEDELTELFAPLGGKISIDKESLDINLFCVIEKTK